MRLYISCTIACGSIYQLLKDNAMATKNSPAVIPRQKAKGVDFCAPVYSYIVRSDLGCYMRCNNFHDGSEISVHPLHQACSGGDHYLAYYHSPDIGRDYASFIIIKGNEFREVESDLSNDTRVGGKKQLHPFCQNGDHYIGLSKYRSFSTDPVFVIIFKDRYHVVSDLSTAIKSKWDKYDKREYALHENCKGGLYYWSTKSFWTGNVVFYFVKQVTQWGFEYHVTEDLHTDLNGKDESFCKSVIEFIPGGMSITMGPVFGQWEIIERGRVEKEIAGTKTEITVKVGMKKGLGSSTEKNWNVKTGVKIEETVEAGMEGIGKAAIKTEFSLETSVGGKIVDSSDESWMEETTIHKTIDFGKLEPGSEYYVWQYVLGRKNVGVLFRSFLWEVTSSSTPPRKAPFQK